MKTSTSIVPLLMLVCGSATAASISVDEATARLGMAMQIAREHNDKAMVAKVEKAGRNLKSAVSNGRVEDAELRAAETVVGIDPGGWSMAGQPLAHPTQEMLAHSRTINARLDIAMQSDDPAKVRGVTAEMVSLLGGQAGVPDGRRMGVKATVHAMSEAEAARLFVTAIRSEGRRVRQLAEGNPLPDQMLRVYASVLQGVCDAHASIQTHVPDALPEMDRLAKGCAQILLDRQQPSGLFPFPDLRNKNIRFGDMLTRAAKAGTLEVVDGWVISPDPDGGSQFDTGVCASALLSAAEVYGRQDWKQAALKAADWALAQRCVRNFNYNAFSVSLLARAFKATGEARYLAGALQKLRVGVAPGQAPNGRWIDSHNARTVYHVIILRALSDLASVLPDDQRAEVDAISKPAIKTLLDEFDIMGITVDALPELLALRTVNHDDDRLKQSTQAMASMLAGKCTDGTKVKMGTSAAQLAAVIRTWASH